jgi:hypothetical protein
MDARQFVAAHWIEARSAKGGHQDRRHAGGCARCPPGREVPARQVISPLFSDRIPEPKARKPCKIRVGAVQLGLVLNSERCEVRIRGKVGGGAQRSKQSEHDGRVPLGRMKQQHLRLLEP